MVTRVPVAPSLLTWARDRSGRTDAEFEGHFGSWDSWVQGQIAPTLRQVEEIARYSHLPFGVFFLSEPPQVDLPIPDYRLGTSGQAEQPSQDLLDVIDSSVRRQQWFREYAERHDIGAARIEHWEGSPPHVVARRVERELDFSVNHRVGMSRADARNHLRRRFEALGGLPVFTSMVGNNTRRPLDRQEFRGFTLADDIAPLIFVNTHDDTLSGQIFTFLHEYAHVIRRESGVGNEDPRWTVLGGVEGWCNQVASEVLVPEEDLAAHYRPDMETQIELDRLANRYICSTLVVLLKLRSTGLVAIEGFDEVYAAEEERVAELARAQPRRDGGDFYLNQPFRIGERLSRAVLAAVASGETTFTEAFGLLELRNAKQLDSYAKSLGTA